MPDLRWHSPPLIRFSVGLHGVALVALLAAPGLWPWVLAALVINHLLIAAAGLWPRSQWLGQNLVRLPEAAIARNEFALTIDDGPDPLVTPHVLDVLDQYEAQATFFCIGDQAERYPALCREIVRRGHTVENHSQQHRNYFSLMGPAGLARELKAAQDTITRISGQRPLFFRAPAGLRNPFLAPVLGQLRLTLASWSIRGFDTRAIHAPRVSKTLLGGLQAGAILLLHDGNAARTPDGTPVILEVLPTLLDAAAVAGLRAVTLRQAIS
jgi:peptidoglycan-N-acetylglucosamine deacetylase